MSDDQAAKMDKISEAICETQDAGMFADPPWVREYFQSPGADTSAQASHVKVQELYAEKLAELEAA